MLKKIIKQILVLLFKFVVFFTLTFNNKINAAAAATVNRPSVRIIGGFPANDFPIPYIVSLVAYGNHVCGGAIVNERTIITAAHCVVYTSPILLRVHAGAKTLSLHEGVLHAVKAIHFHTGYTAATMDYDIGLVRLILPLIYSPTIQPIKLPERDYIVRDGSGAIVAGWGYQSISGLSAELLRYARVPIVNQLICNQLLGGTITDRMICAGYQQGGVDACQMDSGGPLVTQNKLIGIVSWGVGCGLPDKPGVYTRVTELLPWIGEIMTLHYNEKI